MLYSDYTCTNFVESLSSKAPIPGGGGAAALAGAVGTALGSMVCNLTTGKKKYAQYEEQILGIIPKAKAIEKNLISLIDKDAESFLPLSRLYGASAATAEEAALKEEKLQMALKGACDVPIQVIKAAYEGIKLHEELVDIGSRLAISDVGVGVQCLRAALIGANLNVLINLQLIKDPAYISRVKKETELLVTSGIEISDKVYEKVVKSITK